MLNRFSVFRDTKGILFEHFANNFVWILLILVFLAIELTYEFSQVFSFTFMFGQLTFQHLMTLAKFLFFNLYDFHFELLFLAITSSSIFILFLLTYFAIFNTATIGACTFFGNGANRRFTQRFTWDNLWRWTTARWRYPFIIGSCIVYRWRSRNWGLGFTLFEELIGGGLENVIDYLGIKDYVIIWRTIRGRRWCNTRWCCVSCTMMVVPIGKAKLILNWNWWSGCWCWGIL